MRGQQIGSIALLRQAEAHFAFEWNRAPQPSLEKALCLRVYCLEMTCLILAWLLKGCMPQQEEERILHRHQHS